MLANGATVTVDGLRRWPVAELPADATLMSSMLFQPLKQGETVLFGDLEAVATAGGSGFLVTVPLAAETGDVTLVMDNRRPLQPEVL